MSHLDNSSNVHGERRGAADQQEYGHVEREGCSRIAHKDGDVEGDRRVCKQLASLQHCPGDGQEGKGAGRNVVQRGDGVEAGALWGRGIQLMWDAG